MSKTKIIDHTNKKWFWTHLNNEHEVEEVCKYLADNNLKIEIIGNFEGEYQGGGQNVILEVVDLSGNGFCFEGKNLFIHVRYFRKLQEISKTDEFKNWLKKFEDFELVKRYIIDKDQSWIYEDKLKNIFSKEND